LPGNPQNDFVEYEPASPCGPGINSRSNFLIEVHNHSVDMPTMVSALIKEMDKLNMSTVNLERANWCNLNKSVKNIRDNYPKRFIVWQRRF
jgi:hypothetical protein